MQFVTYINSFMFRHLNMQQLMCFAVYDRVHMLDDVPLKMRGLLYIKYTTFSQLLCPPTLKLKPNY